MDRTTIKNAGVGFLVGLVLTFIPLVTLVAPLVGGVVAGYRERRGPKGGVLVGALAGAFIAVAVFLLTTGIAALRFGFEGVLPIQGVPPSTLLAGFLIGTVLTLISVIGTVVVAAIGGGLGGLLEEDRSLRRAEDAVMGAVPGYQPRSHRLLTAAVSLVGGVVTFVAIALGLTAALDPYIWPSALVGLSAGAIAGVAVAVLVNHLLSTRLQRFGGEGGTPET